MRGFLRLRRHDPRIELSAKTIEVHGIRDTFFLATPTPAHRVYNPVRHVEWKKPDVQPWASSAEASGDARPLVSGPGGRRRPPGGTGSCSGAKAAYPHAGERPRILGPHRSGNDEPDVRR